MSRVYMNKKWCVRCGKCTETPYLRNNVKLLTPPADCSDCIKCVDIGCGNGRNSVWAKQLGYDVVSVDMAKGELCNAQIITLGKHALPVDDASTSLILANYILMFLSKGERKQVCREIKRIATKGCKLVVELYAAKDSFATTTEALTEMRDELICMFPGWLVIRKSKDKFILEKP